jgi:hypothetical protein
MNGVVSATVKGFLPVTNFSRTDNTYFKNATLDIKGLDMQNWSVDYDYF